jgi:hypothetical protein
MPATAYALAFTASGRAFYVANGDTSTTIDQFDGTTGNQKSGRTNMNGSVRKRASSWGAAGLMVTGDGAVPVTVAFDGTFGAGPNIEVGHQNGVGQFSGTLKGIRIFPTQLSTAQIQALTV